MAMQRVRYFGRHLVGVTAERKFKEGVRDFCSAFDVPHLAYLAESDLPVSELVKLSGFEVRATPASKLNPWAAHLASLSDQELIALIREVAPEHAVVLDAFPEPASKILGWLRSMIIQKEE